MSDETRYSRKPIYHFIFEAFPAFIAENLMKTTIDQSTVDVNRGSVSCGIMTSHKHLLWRSFWPIVLRMFLCKDPVLR